MQEVFITTIALLSLIMMMAFWHLLRMRKRLLNTQEEVKRRAHEQDALLQAHALLANRVEERTMSLSVANAELARANQAKDEFLSAMSHELRTPLTGVLGYSEGLLEEVYGELNEPQRDALSNVVRSGQRLLSVINDILDLTKIASHKVRLEHEEVPLRFICQTCLDSLRPVVNSKQITLSLEFDPQVDTIKTDARRLKQILKNLLDNACKFSPENSQVTLSVKGDLPGRRVSLRVQDQGIGMDEKDFDRIFEPFIQLDGALSRQYEGTGLGLALVYRLVEALGGSLQVFSELNKGSCFDLNLLWERPEEETRYPSAHLRTDQRIPQVVMAENDPVHANLLAKELQNQGYKVIQVHDGETALGEAEEQKPLAIILDLQLPQFDGLAAIRRIRANERLNNTRIIALTSLYLASDRASCLAAGATEYMSKPAHIQQIVNILYAYRKELAS